MVLRFHGNGLGFQNEILVNRYRGAGEARTVQDEGYSGGVLCDFGWLTHEKLLFADGGQGFVGVLYAQHSLLEGTGAVAPAVDDARHLPVEGGCDAIGFQSLLCRRGHNQGMDSFDAQQYI